jgi:hypothetical protein
MYNFDPKTFADALNNHPEYSRIIRVVTSKEELPPTLPKVEWGKLEEKPLDFEEGKLFLGIQTTVDETVLKELTDGEILEKVEQQIRWALLTNFHSSLLSMTVKKHEKVFESADMKNLKDREAVLKYSKKIDRSYKGAEDSDPVVLIHPTLGHKGPAVFFHSPLKIPALLEYKEEDTGQHKTEITLAIKAWRPDPAVICPIGQKRIQEDFEKAQKEQEKKAKKKKEAQ